jgi:hypothetical protein
VIARALEAEEARRLSLYATRSAEATRRRPVSGDGRRFDYRTAFQRDRDRMLHSRAFRRLKHKTQVYVPTPATTPHPPHPHPRGGQLGRTIARALALNEDLAEAIALGHDLGHTRVRPLRREDPRADPRRRDRSAGCLPRWSGGRDLQAQLPVAAGGRPARAALRTARPQPHRPGPRGNPQAHHVEGGFPFPLPDRRAAARKAVPPRGAGGGAGRRDRPADPRPRGRPQGGRRSTSSDVEPRLAAPACGDARAARPTAASEPWRRAGAAAAGTHPPVRHDAIRTRPRAWDRSRHGQARRSSTTPAGWPSPTASRLHSGCVSPPGGEWLFVELKAFIYRFIINHQEVNRQDHRARLVITGLFRAYHATRSPCRLRPAPLSPRSGRPYLRDLPSPAIAAEVDCSRYHHPSGFARLIVDHLAGMSDRFALEEYRGVVPSRRAWPAPWRPVTVSSSSPAITRGFELKQLLAGHARGAGHEVRRPRPAVCRPASTTRTHNDANVLCMGAHTTGVGSRSQMLEVFLDTPFEGGRHSAARRQKRIETEREACS